MVSEITVAVLAGGAFVAGVAVTGLWVASPSLPARTRRRGQTQATDLDYAVDDPADGGWHEDDEDQVVPTDAPFTGYQRFARFAHPDDRLELEHITAVYGRPDPGDAIRARRLALADETALLTDLAARLDPGDAPGAGHHVSAAMDAHIQAILDRAGWGQLAGGELTEALTRTRVGMPTGQYPVVPATDAARRMARVAAAAEARYAELRVTAGGAR